MADGGEVRCRACKDSRSGLTILSSDKGGGVKAVFTGCVMCMSLGSTIGTCNYKGCERGAAHLPLCQYFCSFEEGRDCALNGLVCAEHSTTGADGQVTCLACMWTDKAQAEFLTDTLTAAAQRCWPVELSAIVVGYMFDPSCVVPPFPPAPVFEHPDPFGDAWLPPAHWMASA